MPDLWTKHPDLVLKVLKEAGFTCGVKPTILPQREAGITRRPERTCRFSGKGWYAELYVHDLGELEPSRSLFGAGKGRHLLRDWKKEEEAEEAAHRAGRKRRSD